MVFEVTGLPLGTVKSRLDLALKTLRKVIENGESDTDSVSQMEVCE